MEYAILTIAVDVSTLTRLFTITPACVKCYVAAVKSAATQRWAIGISGSNTFGVEDRIPLKPVLRGLMDDALFIFSHEQTKMNKFAIFTY